MVDGRCLSHIARYASSARSPVQNAQKKHPTDLTAFRLRRIVASTGALVQIALHRVALGILHVQRFTVEEHADSSADYPSRHLLTCHAFPIRKVWESVDDCVRILGVATNSTIASNASRLDC